MNCPRCQSLLIKNVIDEHTFECEAFQCSSCQGFWFSKNEDLAEIERVSEPTLIEFRHIPSSKAQMKPLICPSCNDNTYMHKVENKRDHKVIMDVCPICKGVWLDKGELEAIQHESWSAMLSRLYSWLKES